MRTPPGDVWPAVRTERRPLAADLSGLRAEQWRVAFVHGLGRARLGFDRANQNGIAREWRPDLQDTLEAFAQAAELTRTTSSLRARARGVINEPGR